jgi:hypothetical protein
VTRTAVLPPNTLAIGDRLDHQAAIVEAMMRSNESIEELLSWARAS